MQKSFNIKFAKESKKGEYEPFDVATLEVEIDCESITIDGVAMSETSIHYLIGYGIKQTLGDSYAKFTNAAEAIKAFDAKLARLVNSELDFDGENGRTADPVRQEMRALAEAAILSQLGFKNVAAFEAEHGEKAFRANVNKVLATHEDALRAKAEKIVASRKGIELDLDFITQEAAE